MVTNAGNNQLDNLAQNRVKDYLEDQPSRGGRSYTSQGHLGILSIIRPVARRRGTEGATAPGIRPGGIKFGVNY